jgi:regulatory protein
MAGRRGESRRSSRPAAPGGGQRDGRHQSAAPVSDGPDSERADAGLGDTRRGGRSAERASDGADSERADSERGDTGRGRRSAERASDRADSQRASRGEQTERRGVRAVAEPDREQVARQICLRLLSVAPRTKAELAAALRRRGVPEDAAAAALARFAEVRLIDDELFARAWVESRHHGRGLAGRALGAELRQRGVASAEIEAALGQLSQEQELATARELVERRLPATAGLPPLARMRRLTGVLARKGYSPGLAYRVVRDALDREADSGVVPSYDDEILPEPDDEEATAEVW